MDYYRLEYSEQQACFHLDDGTHQENSFGWVTICELVSDDICCQFFKYCLDRYPVFNYLGGSHDGRHVPTIKEIKLEYELFQSLN